MADFRPVYFSISFDLVPVDQALPFDLFINSSSLKEREKFVRIFPKGDGLSAADLQNFRKYGQLYVPETQRSLYLSSVCSMAGPGVQAKSAVLKDSAIHYLDGIFTKEPSTEVLSQTLVGCRDVVTGFVSTLHNYTIANLQDLIAKLSFHDFYTYDHSINVSMYCIMIYRALYPKATQDEIVQAGMGGLLHDLGKIKIPTSIINNPGQLSAGDLAEIRRHPDYGLTLLTDAKVALPGHVNRGLLTAVVHEHHENFDGTGYPGKLAGDKIHVLGRITAIADFFDAITTKRSYQDPLPLQDALTLMKRSVGKKLDPVLFQLFADQAHFLDRDKVSKIEVPYDFDSCQPHERLMELLIDARAEAKNSPAPTAEGEKESDWDTFLRLSGKKEE